MGPSWTPTFPLWRTPAQAVRLSSPRSLSVFNPRWHSFAPDIHCWGGCVLFFLFSTPCLPFSWSFHLTLHFIPKSNKMKMFCDVLSCSWVWLMPAIPLSALPCPVTSTSHSNVRLLRGRFNQCPSLVSYPGETFVPQTCSADCCISLESQTLVCTVKGAVPTAWVFMALKQSKQTNWRILHNSLPNILAMFQGKSVAKSCQLYFKHEWQHADVKANLCAWFYTHTYHSSCFLHMWHVPQTR